MCNNFAKCDKVRRSDAALDAPQPSRSSARISIRHDGSARETRARLLNSRAVTSGSGKSLRRG